MNRIIDSQNILFFFSKWNNHWNWILFFYLDIDNNIACKKKNTLAILYRHFVQHHMFCLNKFVWWKSFQQNKKKTNSIWIQLFYLSWLKIITIIVIIIIGSEFFLSMLLFDLENRLLITWLLAIQLKKMYLTKIGN